MTAPTATVARPAHAVTLAPNVAQAREAHRLAHHAYLSHALPCLDACGVGGLCDEAHRLLDAADDAGKRWTLAERRAAVARGAGRWL